MTAWLASTSRRRVRVARTCSVCWSASSERSRRAAEIAVGRRADSEELHLRRDEGVGEGAGVPPEPCAAGPASGGSTRWRRRCRPPRRAPCPARRRRRPSRAGWRAAGARRGPRASRSDGAARAGPGRLGSSPAPRSRRPRSTNARATRPTAASRGRAATTKRSAPNGSSFSAQPRGESQVSTPAAGRGVADRPQQVGERRARRTPRRRSRASCSSAGRRRRRPR